MNDVIKQDLPKKVLASGSGGGGGSGLYSLPPHQRIIRMANEESNWTMNGMRKSNVSDISYYNMAFLSADGRVYITGINSSGNLAQGGAAADIDNYKEVHLRSGPADSASLIGTPNRIIMGYQTFMVLTDKGDAAMWGYNGHGQLARNNTSAYDYAQVIDGSDIGPRSGVANREIVKADCNRGYPTGSIGWYAQAKDGTLWAWGYGNHGNLGQNNTSNYSYPRQMLDNTGALVSDCHEFFAGHGDYKAVLMIRTNGTLWACGQNSWGKLGVGNSTQQTRFRQCTGLPSGLSTSDYVKIQMPGSQRGGATAVLLKNGDVYTAGYGSHYFHGNTNSNRNTFTLVNKPSGVTKWLDIWCGGEYPEMWLWGDDNRLYATGYNGQGQLGVGNTSSASGPRSCMGAFGWINPGPAGGNAAIGTNYTGGYIEFGKWRPVVLATGGAYDGANHRHTSHMLGNDGYWYGCGHYGRYGAASTSTNANSWQRYYLPIGCEGAKEGYDEDGTGTSPDRPTYSDMYRPREPGYDKLWEPVAMVDHGYTSQVGSFIRLKNGMVYAVGRNTSNKLGTENNALNPIMPLRVRLGT
tara:strand:- start:321 stop:2057 length:1737 start_codon:yes stop_codon:yes gene_type:complete